MSAFLYDLLAVICILWGRGSSIPFDFGGNELFRSTYVS